MIEKREIIREQVIDAINKREFSQSVVNSAERVVVIMTQDWCPQWIDMESWIYNQETTKTVHVYEIVYNKEDYYKDFLELKENIWENTQIPYLRYYRNGELYLESNYVSAKNFVKDCS